MNSKGRKIPAFLFRFMMNLYPPFFFSRVRIKYVSDDYKEIKIRVRASLLNTNLSGTMFGGTLFSAADPFYPLMYWQNFAQQYQMKVRVWVKSAKVQYKKPAVGDIYLHFHLQQSDIEEAKLALESVGKFNKTHLVELLNKKGELCVRVELEAYVGLDA